MLGLLVVVAGFAVMSGQTWGRVIGIILAVLSLLANFAFIPYYPFWSLTIIAVDVFVIWAISPAMRARSPSGSSVHQVGCFELVGGLGEVGQLIWA